MAKHSQKRNDLFRISSLCLMLYFMALPLSAQQSNDVPGAQQVDPNGFRKPTAEQEEFNRKLRRGEQPVKERTHFEPRLAEAQIREDFRRLQVINNRIQAGDSRTGSKELVKLLTEMRKRAKRLEVNLVFPSDEATTSEVAENPSELAAYLQILNISVKSFVTNPMFGSMKVVDVERAREGKADLEKIIRVSEMAIRWINKENK